MLVIEPDFSNESFRFAIIRLIKAHILLTLKTTKTNI